MRKIVALLMISACAAASAGCGLSELAQLRQQQQTPAPTSEPAAFETFTVSDAPAETPSDVNLRAVENFAVIWNQALSQSEDLQIVPAAASASVGEGMLEGGQIFQYALPPGRLYLYLLEGQLVGARMEANTNAWADTSVSRQWNACWKTMIQSVNGNWNDSHYIDVINKLSDGFPPAGQETGDLASDVITDNGWVYQMEDVDLGYEFEKEVSAWLSQFAGAHT